MSPPNSSASTVSAFAPGFESQLHECIDLSLPVKGKVPDWLEGHLVRNGPAKFEAGLQQYRHWFDGLAKLHKFSFAAGEAKLTCKFLETDAYRIATADNRIGLAEFGTNPSRSFIEKLANPFNPMLTDNANVNLVNLNEHYLGLTETVNTVEFDCRDLTTIGKFTYDDKLAGQVTTAHPHYDFERRELYNLLIKLGPTSAYVIYKVGHGTTARKEIAVIKTKAPCYFHSFAVSANYIILVECPFVVNPLDVILGNKTYVESYSWKGNNATRVSVYSKEHGELVAFAETDAFFCFHHVNAFEENGDVVIDLLAYPDAQIVQSTYLANLRNEDCSLPLPKLRRLRLSLASKKMSSENICEAGLELPRIYYERVNGKAYNYVYAPGQDDGKFLNRLVKFNVKTNELKDWRQDECYPGEPVFVARPDAVNEDDGVVLSVVLDAARKKSFLIVLDAASMDEMARMELPLLVPFGFHGQFFRN
ncbi:MAG: carotenoid oxygenase family protein [Candidatus Obscuribacterales bacterium]|nr:carotenoid oxygenase family protein [Candidatus Obscuribacterales bacterium]